MVGKEKTALTDKERDNLACQIEAKINLISENMTKYIMRQIDACNPCFDKVKHCFPCWHNCPCTCKEPEIENKKLGLMPVIMARPQNTAKCSKHGYKRNS